MIKLYQVELISLTCSTMQRTVPGTSELLLVSRKTFRTRPADPAAGARFRVVVLYFRDLYRMGSPR